MAPQQTHIATIALNLPGPLAVARLAEFGARVTKIEPPGGDSFAQAAPEWYAVLHRGATVRRLDLKHPEGRAELDEILSDTDLFVTSQRPAALQRLGLTWGVLHNRFPRLCHLAIVGHPAPHQELPGHDLTYLAHTGLLSPPHLPRTLMADLYGGERAASAALALLLTREQTGRAGYAEVALADAAELLALPLRHDLTGPGNRLGGGFAGYNLYETSAGWVALGALEPHFWQRFRDTLSLGDDPAPETIRTLFRTRTAQHWVTWGEENDIPLVKVE